LVALHSVRHAGTRRILDAGGEEPALGQRAVGADVEDADVGLLGVVDIEQFLVGREAEAVWLAEEIAAGDQLRLARGRARRNAEHALPAEFARSLDAEAWHAA